MNSSAQQQPTAPESASAWSLPQAAKRVNCSRRFLEKQIKLGALRSVHLSSRCVRIRPHDLAQWLEQRVSK
jgi:excisionase family DNA binding protein